MCLDNMRYGVFWRDDSVNENKELLLIACIASDKDKEEVNYAQHLM